MAFFRRQSTRDGIYGINVAPLSRKRHIGTPPSVRADWQISRHLIYTAIYSHFFAGRFLKQTPPGEDIDYISTCLRFRLKIQNLPRKRRNFHLTTGGVYGTSQSQER